MKPTTFFCPHCGTKLNKSDEIIFMGESRGNITIFGKGVVSCPSCGKAIEKLSIAEGKYDKKK